MDVLEAYDLTKSLRGAAELTGVDHHTVARYVAARAAGRSIEEMAQERPKASDDFADKIAEFGPFRIIYDGQGGIPGLCWELKDPTSSSFTLYQYAD